MSLKDEILRANEEYAARFDLGGLPGPPRRRLAVVACMDARIDPAASLGLREGDAHVIRNAGAVVTGDVLRSLVVSNRLLETEEVFVVAHTGCGMLNFTDDELRARLREETGADPGELDFHAFSDLAESVRASVARVRESPFLGGVRVSGWIYEVETGRLREVPL